jgi:carbonic anhydrase/acetyltransferase-like protein (isoleucine patch superfamily)
MSEHPDSIVELQKIYPHRFKRPQIHSSVWLAPGSHVVGDTIIGRDSSLWFNSILRGDVNYIRVGERTNIQDLSMVHVSYQASPTIIGNDVTIGHSTIIHACTIGNFSLIGMGCVLMDEVEIGDYVILGAGSLVTQKTKIPSGTKAFGRPAKVVGELNEAERERIRFSSEHYCRLARAYLLALNEPSGDAGVARRKETTAKRTDAKLFSATGKRQPPGRGKRR